MHLTPPAPPAPPAPPFTGPSPPSPPAPPAPPCQTFLLPLPTGHLLQPFLLRTSWTSLHLLLLDLLHLLLLPAPRCPPGRRTLSWSWSPRKWVKKIPGAPKGLAWKATESSGN
uniref:Uncharacterized protein n=1 Tax=Knipowitschia caucasica TaxID=637954 RepID=A0AAV2IV44_KNICA